jgi:hypothetical protein
VGTGSGSYEEKGITVIVTVIALVLLVLLVAGALVFFTPKSKEEKTPNFQALIKKIPADWSREDFILCGSAALAVRGIRDVRDLDILVRPSLMATIPVTKDVDGYTEKFSEDIDIFDKPLRLENFLTFDDIKRTAELFDGYYVQSPRHTLAIKLLLPSPRAKDVPDIISLSQVIAAEPIKLPTVNTDGFYR